MTAINIIRHQDSVSIMTDTAGYDTDGILRSFAMKCIPIPHLRAAVATRGSGFATPFFATNFAAKFQTFDALIEYGAAFSDQLHAHYIEWLAASGEAEVNIAVAGWSERRNRPEAYFLFSDEVNGQEPWTFHATESVEAGPVPSDEYLEAAGINAEMNPRRFDPMTDGLNLMKAQRAMSFPCGPTKTPRHLVGGAAVVTLINSSFIGQTVIHRWNDVIGEPIKHEPLSSSPPVSRQQRRAAARAKLRA